MRTLYRAARVHTLADPRAADWLLVDGRHVQRAGSGDPPGADRVVELPGSSIVPGFVDAHVHLTSTGLGLANADVEATTSAEQLLGVAAARSRGARDVPVLLRGYDETRWHDPTIPTIHELDDATEAPLVILRVDSHVALANGRAIADAQVGDAEGLERGSDGEPTGRVTGGAVERLIRWIAGSWTDLEVQELQLSAGALAASHGVTTIHEMSMPGWYGLRDLQVLLGHRERLPVDVFTVVATTDLAQVIDLGLTAVGGDLAVDGSIGARTAAISEPYADSVGTGSLYLDADGMAEFFHDGHMAGLQVGVHAIGDRAVEQMIATWERVYHALDSRERRHFRARRHRIEHFEMASADHVERAAMLGLAASVQPGFDAAWGGPDGLYELALGAGRAAAMNPFRTMLERGLEVGAGSDSPITALDPMRSIAACEAHHDRGQRLAREEAIRLHTIGGARLAHQGTKKGALAPGMHADFSVFEEDPFTAAALDGLRPILTVSLGREVFAR
ncbi:MAG: amidohydrolase family protein [Actinomycetota bacterium]